MIARLAAAWGIAAAIQLVLWLVQQRTRVAGIVDIGWALSFTPVVAVFALTAESCACGWGVLAALVAVWSLRLGGYLVSRGAARAPEEGRYADLRARWSPHASRSFFVFFQAQALLTAVLSSAFVVPFVVDPRDGTWWLRALGGAVAIAGILGEAIADAQLARFKRTATREQVCDVGLWGWSRHPNYFFEWLYWVGLATYGLAFPGGWIALGAQALILASIFGVTGIPPTETQAIRTKDGAYREYQRRVNRFIPLPPESRGRNA